MYLDYLYHTNYSTNYMLIVLLFQIKFVTLQQIKALLERDFNGCKTTDYSLFYVSYNGMSFFAISASDSLQKSLAIQNFRNYTFRNQDTRK